MKIALALSGGGFRATVFHFGVLARLARQNRLEDVNFLSTVSGGSLGTGLVFALNNFQWPTSEQYLNQVLPEAKRLLTTKDLQRSIIARALTSIWNIFDTRADDLSRLMQENWGVTAKLSELPREPRWIINATCYESGKNWRFERFQMGDYLFGYTRDTDIPLSDAMAASGGFPGAIGPLKIDASKYSWFKYSERSGSSVVMNPEVQVQWKTEPVQPLFPEAHLWDGGVYDNHGLEGLHNFVTGWRDKVDFLIVSDASGVAKPEKYARGVKALLRMATGIMKEQIRSLRARAVVERMILYKGQDDGVYLQTGNTCSRVLFAAGKKDKIPEFCPGCLSDEEAVKVAEMPTVIRKLTHEEYDRLFRHGYEVADYTLYAYYPEQFDYLGFQNV
jgi:NTE family protein